MHLLKLCLLVVLCSTSSSWALHESEAGIIDWHKRQIGIPRIESFSTAPVFHRVGEKTTRSVLLTATENNVLAALNPVNGSVAWRYIFEHSDVIVQFNSDKNVVAALSGPGGATVRSFDALTGQLLVERRLHSPESGRISNPPDLGTDIGFLPGDEPYPDVIVLTNGYTVRRIGGFSGEIRWSWAGQDPNTRFIISHLIATPTEIYLVGLEKATATYTLVITVLSSTTGQELKTARIPSSISHGMTDVIALNQPLPSNHPSSPVIAWLQQGTPHSLILTPDLRRKPTTIKGPTYQRFIDIGLSGHGQFIAVKPDGSSNVFKLNTEGTTLAPFWDFADTAPSQSLFAGGLDSKGRPYVARIHWSFVFQQASIEVLCSHLGDGQGLVTSFTFPFEAHLHGTIRHIAVDAANPEGWKVLARVAVTTTTGAIQLWHQDKVQWTREESLASISVAEFVELPETKVAASHLGEGRETFFTRLRRQLSEAQNFPEYLVNFVRRFATGSYESASSYVAPSAQTGPLSRDTFGFRKIIVAASPVGKVFGIDSSNGNVIWSRVLGLGWAAEVGGTVIPLKLFVVRTVSDGGSPEVVLVTQRKADNSLVDTVIFHIDALTGEDVRNVSRTGGIFQGLDIIAGPLLEAFLFHEGGKAVILVDEFLQTHIYPDTSANRDAYMKSLPRLHFPLRAGPQRIIGHQAVFVEELGNRVVAYPTWSLDLAPGEQIKTMTPSSHGPVASVGKALGNRTTLYKYLNQQLFVVLTASTSVSSSICGIYLIDAVKGTIVYRTTLAASAGGCDIKATLTENWLVYHYYEDNFAVVGQAKGYRMVSVELYEGQQADDKTKSSDMSSYSKDTVNVTAIEQSYVFPHGITAMATTSTKFGITAKDIIVANENHQIQSHSRRLLNPRRPDRKPTSAEQEEFLIQYDPLLPDDPYRVLSHNYEVAKIERIVTSPAFLESTSLVFAYGLDLFLTRTTPSNTFDVLNENFNKAQLVLTVSGLAVAIMITKPMVARKRLRERWYS